MDVLAAQGVWPARVVARPPSACSRRGRWDPLPAVRWWSILPTRACFQVALTRLKNRNNQGHGYHPRNRAAADPRGLAAVRRGDTVKVHYKIIEGQRERTQVFQGVITRRHGASNRETFTVRKISFGVGVERTFPVHSPKIEKVEIITSGKVRRAKLYFLRDKVGKAARLKEKGF